MPNLFRHPTGKVTAEYTLTWLSTGYKASEVLKQVQHDLLF